MSTEFWEVQSEDTPNRKDLIDIGAKQFLYQSALFAARQGFNQSAFEY